MNIRTKILIAVALVAIGVSGRLLPHAFNFAPIVAIGLFAGAYLGPRFAFAVPIAAMFISDIFIGFYELPMNISVYIGMGLAGAIGILLRNGKNPLSIALASVSASTVFYLATNGAVWLFTDMYPESLSGLFASLSAGIPFYKNALAGDVWYSFALFGGFEFARYLYARYSPRLAKAASLISFNR